MAPKAPALSLDLTEYEATVLLNIVAFQLDPRFSADVESGPIPTGSAQAAARRILAKLEGVA